MRRKLSLIAGAFALTAGSVFFAAAPAQAHTACATLSSGGSVRAEGCMYDAHHWATICDRKADNIGPLLRLWSDNGGYYEVRDGNGSQSGCGGRHSVGLESYTAWEVCCKGSCSGRLGA
jgi:hypothetical protein